jgi:hypothetical protein
MNMTYRDDKPKSGKVPGTGRREWVTGYGDVLQYQNIYMKPYAWEMLKDLARSHDKSGSQVLEMLIAKAAGYDIARQQ